MEQTRSLTCFYSHFGIKKGRAPIRCTSDLYRVFVSHVFERRLVPLSLHVADSLFPFLTVKDALDGFSSCAGLAVVGGSRVAFWPEISYSFVYAFKILWRCTAPSYQISAGSSPQLSSTIGSG